MKKGNKLWKKVFSVALTASILMGMTACGNSSETAAETKETDTGEIAMGDTLVYCSHQEPSGLDTVISPAYADHEVSRPIFEGLLELDENMRPQKQLCLDYSSKEDYKEWIFKLREGVLFHNGKEMTSEDVVASMNRWIECGKATGAQEIGNARFEAVDTYTVKIVLDHSISTFDYLIADFTYHPIITTAEAVAGADPITGLKEFIGTGPYKFVEYVPGSHISYDRYEEYQGPGYAASGDAGDRVAYFQHVKWEIVTDASIRTSSALSNEYDVTGGISYDDASMFEGDNYQILKNYAGLCTVTFNKRSEVMSDLNTRLAIEYAADPEELMAAIVPIEGFSTVSPCYMAGVPEYVTDVGKEYWKLDTEKAKEAFDASAYDGTPIVIVATQMWPNLYNASLLLQEDLQNLGFNVDLRTYDWPTMLSYIVSDKDWDIFLMWGDNPVLPTSIGVLKDNSGGYCNSENALALKEELTVETEEGKKVELYTQIQEQLYADGQGMCLGTAYDPYVANSDLKDVEIYLGFVPWGCHY